MNGNDSDCLLTFHELDNFYAYILSVLDNVLTGNCNVLLLPNTDNQIQGAQVTSPDLYTKVFKEV